MAIPAQTLMSSGRSSYRNEDDFFWIAAWTSMPKAGGGLPSPPRALAISAALETIAPAFLSFFQLVARLVAAARLELTSSSPTETPETRM